MHLRAFEIRNIGATGTFLPPYSPDLNPIERLWLLIKAEWFTDFIAKTRDQLCERLDQALCWAMDRDTANQATCAIKKKL